MNGDEPATLVAAELQQLLLDTPDITDFLQELVVLAVGALPAEVSCGLTMRRDHRAMTVTSSDLRASQADEVQYQHDDGPCLTSLRTGEPVEIADLVEDDRWGSYRSSALAHGIRSSLSLPLSAAGQVIGALNFYSSEPGRFGERERELAAGFAGQASRALALAIKIADRADLSENLRAALASRAVIDQALGIIMGQNRCSAGAAFELLRSISQNRNVKLRDVAVQMVTAVGGEPADEQPRFG
jgi:GAF domain-containing protein